MRSLARSVAHSPTHSLALRSLGRQRSTIALGSPLSYSHYGGAEYQSEVALLTRNIMIMGTADVEASKIGPQIKLGGSKRHRVRGVLAYRMGQRNVKGAYPFHFHMLGSAPESYLFDNVVVRSYYRCFVVHGTSNTQVMRNVRRYCRRYGCRRC